ncbi:MAG: hemerythrin domain-containing protein [Deltaproteobacteria bacterium]
MIVQLGKRSIDGDVDVLLSECHLRIRRFLALAVRITAQRTSALDVQEAGGQVRRYFAEAFPLHLADEDELLMPVLMGRESTLDRAIERMHRDHAEHEPHVAHLVELCAALERDPGGLAALVEDLAVTTKLLREVLEPHLLLEEREIFPAIRLLSDDERGQIRAAMRARRAS